MKKYTVLVLSFLLSMGANVGFVIYNWNNFFPPHQEEKNKQKPTLVKVQPIKQESIVEQKTFSGTIRANKEFLITAEFPGRIKKIMFKEGEAVKEGDVLLQLDDDQAKSELSSSMANKSFAEKNLKRQKDLAKYQSTSLSNLEKAESEYSMATAAVEKAQTVLKGMKIYAPFSGEIGAVNVSRGAYITQNQEVARLVSQKKIVEFSVPEVEKSFFTKNKKILVYGDGFDVLPYFAYVNVVEPFSDPVTHTVKIKAILDPQCKLSDGTFARLVVDFKTANNAMVVPVEAVKYDQKTDQSYVYTIAEADNGMRYAIEHSVTRGITQKEKIQIISPTLKEGDVIIVDPVDFIAHESYVELDDEKDN